MFQAILIGNLGGDAQVKVADGREFVTFRVAHNESYTDAQGNKVERTQWVDVTMNCNNGQPAVLPYLVAGTLICVQGSLSTRVYSSERDRCYKAGVTIHASKVELLGGAADAVPRRLFDSAGAMIEVRKCYNVQTTETTLRDQRGREYDVIEGGWVALKQQNNEETEPF